MKVYIRIEILSDQSKAYNVEIEDDANGTTIELAACDLDAAERLVMSMQLNTIDFN